jgi:hypothetical protein
MNTSDVASSIEIFTDVLDLRHGRCVVFVYAATKLRAWTVFTMSVRISASIMWALYDEPTSHTVELRKGFVSSQDVSESSGHEVS